MRLLITLGTLAIAAQAAAAQSVPNITKPKQAAQKAVAATNAQTAKMTTVAEDTATVATPAGARAGVATDSAAGTTTVTARVGAAFERETFSYERGGRRDPFISLMTTSELRPLISDLQLVAVAFDAGGRTSVAIMRDINTKEQYRVRTGQSLGRMRVAHIAPKSVTFTIEEFGYSRQEVLALSDSKQARKQ
jgi:hypothetical protein